MLTHFRWYRRLRGGYWSQVPARIQMFSRWRWIRRGHAQPTPDRRWEFYPWARAEMSQGYVDEWHSTDPSFAVPLSEVICEECKAKWNGNKKGNE